MAQNSPAAVIREQNPAAKCAAFGAKQWRLERDDLSLLQSGMGETCLPAAPGPRE
jgi:hypothetical protein